jgi:hypothetical protein
VEPLGDRLQVVVEEIRIEIKSHGRGRMPEDPLHCPRRAGRTSGVPTGWLANIGRSDRVEASLAPAMWRSLTPTCRFRRRLRQAATHSARTRTAVPEARVTNPHCTEGDGDARCD